MVLLLIAKDCICPKASFDVEEQLSSGSQSTMVNRRRAECSRCEQPQRPEGTLRGKSFLLAVYTGDWPSWG